MYYHFKRNCALEKCWEVDLSEILCTIPFTAFYKPPMSKITLDKELICLST